MQPDLINSNPSWAELNSKYSSPSFSSNKEICQDDSASKTAPVIASDPSASAALYRKKQLWTDFNVGGTSIRVAFRFVVDSNSDRTDESSQNDEIYVCWIHSNGKPCHFYSVSPTSDSSEVDGDDHIETTFAGHGFVFCKLLNDDMTKDIVDRVKSGRIYGCQIENKDGIYVLEDDCCTIFLRKREADQSESDSEEESESESEEQNEDRSDVEKEGSDCDSCDESDDDSSQVSEVSHWSFIEKTKITAVSDTDEDKEVDLSSVEEESIKPADLEGDWDAYLIVGGFRPGTETVTAADAQDDNKVESDNETESKEHDQDVESDSDSDDDEWSMQLVTLKQQKVVNKNPNQKSRSSLRGTQKDGNESSIYQDFFNQNQFALTAKLNKLDPTPISSVNKRYDSNTLGGWPCRVEPESLSHRKLRKRIAADLKVACSRLPPHARKKLQRSTPIWINKTLAYGPKVAPIRGANMCFHPGSSWLIRNGMSPAKKGGVEMFKSSAYLDDCHLWGVGGLMLHELSHAWHYLHCDDGYDNATIQECYDKAMKEKLYECVPFHCSRGKKDRRKAYACTNAMEYFAELSAAFLGGLDDKEYNKWYPFNRKQIKEHDPRAFDMLCQMWGEF